MNDFIKNILHCMHTESSDSRPFSADSRIQGPFPVLLFRS